jgi:hypothetical protein
MKFLKSLLGKDKDKDESPAWKVRPASERPAGRPRQPLQVDKPPREDVPQQPKKAPDPFLDDPMLDTMTLEVDLSSADDNPYATNSWATTQENETRKLKTIQIGAKTEKDGAADFNPYDTGKMRRSWKR